MFTVCMIRPPRPFASNTFTSGSSIPPLGLAYLNSSLEAAGLDVYAIDAIGEDIENFYALEDIPGMTVHGMYLEDIVAKIPDYTKLIGISCMFSDEWFLTDTLILLIKARFPDVLIVTGGEHVTAEAGNILKTCPGVDICVSGEGEETLVALARAISNDEDWKQQAGISYRNEDAVVVKNSPRKRIRELDFIPIPSWKNIPLHRYHQKGYSVTALFKRSMPVIASRGCPFSCTFCSSPQMWGTNLIMRNPRLVFEEIKRYKEEFDVDHIDFVDTVGFFNRQWIVEFLNLLIEADLNVTWVLSPGTRSEILDDEILELFKKAKVLKIFFSPESGSEETIKRIKKKLNLRKIMHSMKFANEIGISTRAPLIYGFPGQTMKEALQNALFSLKLAVLGVDDVVGISFAAYPGSELFRDLTSSGKINVDNLIQKGEYHRFLATTSTAKIRDHVSWSNDIPNWSLPLFQYGVMALTYGVSFLFHPSKLLRTVENIFIKRRPLTLLEHVMFEFLVERRFKTLAGPRKFYEYRKNTWGNAPMKV